MSTDLIVDLTVFVLSLLVGFEVISKVPATLHTPLMSGANSIHGIVVVGAMLVAAAVRGWPGYLLAFVAMAFATMNVVGGYVVTDRMLQMFRTRPAPVRRPDDAPASPAGRTGAAPPAQAGTRPAPTGPAPAGARPATTGAEGR